MSSEHIGYCGVDCGKCPAYRPSCTSHGKERERAVVFFKETFGSGETQKGMTCDGCKSTSGPHFDFCTSCRIRKSARAGNRPDAMEKCHPERPVMHTQGKALL